MNRIFADTYYFLGLISPRDAAHAACIDYSANHDPPLISTAWIFTELADGLGNTSNRHLFSRTLRLFEEDENHLLVPASDELFRGGLQLYENRPDKQWSLTDCISFVVMEQYGVTESLTADQHFEQAGFAALLA